MTYSGLVGRTPAAAYAAAVAYLATLEAEAVTDTAIVVDDGANA